eukprot:Blabericola_migrator_1__10293@NODE_577_length_7504_cov_115_679710_g61_i1_p2_GENE_NODE_577_length_7504_cov_115_679710_g61_i1NODE_577_length_7504_cov_115_679710_g61_i1_p2_ORF_typecomplete_len618_score112_37DSPc/PF00782_20/1_3e10Y_phosphatase/PF00102_27/0_0068Y_phosphatase/PF00102_27/1_8e03DUF3987/PF13148_6/4_9e02DUF3987/PF13148_6/40DUF3987/PF13148_6/2_9_NODE_577_length_7504_cov_115_679710_g61_i14942347
MDGLSVFGVDSISNIDSILVEGKHENDFDKDASKFQSAALAALASNVQTGINTIIHGHLLLGSREHARSGAVMAKIGVTDILTMAWFPTGPREVALSPESYSNIRVWDAQIPDSLGFPFIARLRSVLHLIQNHIFNAPSMDFTMSDIGRHDKSFKCQNNRVLFVHCIQGVSRSAAIVIGYIMLRLYCSQRRGEKLFDLWDLIAAVKKCRHCCPNATFLAHLFFLWETLKVIHNHSKATHALDTEKAREVRLTEFDSALQFGETYFNSYGRNILETFGLMNEEILGTINRALMQVQAQGLASLSLKRSLLKQASFWLSRAVFIRSANVYLINTEPLFSCLIAPEEDRAYEKMLFQHGLVEPEQLTGWRPTETLEQMHRVPLGIPSTAVPGWTAADVPMCSSQRLCEKTEAIKPPRYPKRLFYDMDPEARERWITYGLGYSTEEPENNDFDVAAFFPKCAQTCDEVGSRCSNLMTMFGCRTWVLWIFSMIGRDCAEFKLHCRAWNNAVHQRLMRHDDVADDAQVKVVSMALEGPDWEKNTQDLEAEVNKSQNRTSVSDLTRPLESCHRSKSKHREETDSEDQPTRKRIRYGDVTVEMLNYEIARAKLKLRKLNQALTRM